MKEKPKKFKEIALKRERQATGIMFREYGANEAPSDEETVILRIPAKAGYGAPTISLSGVFSHEEIRQLDVWLTQGRPPNVIIKNYRDEVKAKIETK